MISAKVTYNTSQETRDPDKLWLEICAKRDACNKTMKKIKEMAFFFSSVAVVANECEEGKDGDKETVNNNSQRKKKIYWPAISYWIALQSRDGLRMSTIPVHSARLDTGMEVTAKSVQECSRGKEGNAVAPLCTTLKDHNNSFLQRKVDVSFQHCLEALEWQVLEEPVPSIHGSDRVVRLQVGNPVFPSELQNRAIQALTRVGLLFDVLGIENVKVSESRQSMGRALPKSAIVVALNKIERVMAKRGYGLHKGDVFKKNEASMYTFEHACSIKKFLSVLANNDQLKEIIITDFNKVESILADPECKFTQQLRINYDLIEVLDGWCFSLSQRRFVQNPIKEIGKECPRAFVQYPHTKEPEAKHFQSILENSISPTGVTYFCEYYLRLLNHGIKPREEKVLLNWGAKQRENKPIHADHSDNSCEVFAVLFLFLTALSGRKYQRNLASVFQPLRGALFQSEAQKVKGSLEFVQSVEVVYVSVDRFIAMITKQKTFNKRLVDQKTQVIFMDETHVKLLDPDDWKGLMQGGLTAHDRKYRSSSQQEIRCPMFITCQSEMDFGEEHNAAMDARLRKFYFKSLNSRPVTGVQQSLRDSAMDCIVWASKVACTPDDELPPPMPGSASKPNELDEGEKDRIRTMNLEDSESNQEASVGEGQLTVEDDNDISEGEDNQVNSDAKSTSSDGWESTLEKICELRDQQPCNSLRQRQLGFIVAGVKRATKERETEAQRSKAEILAETRQHWISLGMIREEDAHLLETVEGPYHPRIKRSREEYLAKKKEDEQKNLQDKASKYYENEWVWAKEKELRQLQEQEETARDGDVQRAVHYMIGVTVEALKLNFKRDELPGLSRLVIMERKRRAMDMK